MKGAILASLTIVSVVSVSLTLLLAPYLMVANAPTPNPAVLIDGEPIANLIAISYSINYTGEMNRTGTSVDELGIVGEIILEGDNRQLVEDYLTTVAQVRPFQLVIVYSIGLEFSEPIEEQGLLRKIYSDECYCTSISGKIEGQSAVTTITFQGTRLRFELIQ